jgi:transcriptional regulator with XRE-family HTH domain
MLVEELGKCIKKRRNELSITQSHLAELTEISVNTLYKLERGEGNPSLDILCRLADILGMQIELKVKQ